MDVKTSIALLQSPESWRRQLPKLPSSHTPGLQAGFNGRVRVLDRRVGALDERVGVFNRLVGERELLELEILLGALEGLLDQSICLLHRRVRVFTAASASSIAWSARSSAWLAPSAPPDDSSSPSMGLGRTMPDHPDHWETHAKYCRVTTRPRLSPARRAAWRRAIARASAGSTASRRRRRRASCAPWAAPSRSARRRGFPRACR